MRRFFLKLLRWRQLERDLEAELAFHREMSAAQENPVPLGNTSVIKEHAFDLWRFTTIENVWRDLVYGVRGLRRSPALVVSALLSLALGIGVNTAMFSLAMEFIFSAPSVRDSGSVVSVRVAGGSNAKPQILDFIRRSGLFAELAGENEETFINWNDGSETRRIFSVQTTKDFFTALGVPVAYGRGYQAGDPDEVAVLHHRFWTKYYGSDLSVLGRVIRLNGKAYTVVGILPEMHRTLIGAGFSPDVYVPSFLEETTFAMYGRLKPGMSLPEARSALVTVARRLDDVIPEHWRHGNGCRVVPVAGFWRLQEDGELLTVGLFFLLLQVMVGLVLLIACVNVASLLLARASARRREIAIRLSLGAGRARLLQQLLIESLLLSVLGAGLGLLLSRLLAAAMSRVQLPLPVPIRLHFELDWRVALYAACLTIVATLASGLLPAWQASRSSISSDLNPEGRMRLRRLLVVGQVAVSFLVLATGFLFVRNLMRSNSISPGFDVLHTVRAEVNLPPSEYKDLERKRTYIREALRALEALPGIEAVAAARIIPFTDSTRFGSTLTFPETGQRVEANFQWNAVSPDYFRAMQIPIVAGRTFGERHAGASLRSVIVNRAFADRYVTKGRVVGRTFLWADGKNQYEIVGVVEGTRNLSIGEEDRPQLYEDLAQIDNDRTRIQFVARSSIPPSLQLNAVRQAMRRVDPNAGLEVATLYASIGLAFLPSQVGAVLLGGIGVLGLLLAMIGLYGVMVYSVTRRTREIGVRMAIGARAADISKMVTFEAVKLVGLGCALGLLVSVFITRPLAMFLVAGLAPGDPASLCAVLAVFTLTGLLAASGPVRRALTIDPARCLRAE